MPKGVKKAKRKYTRRAQLPTVSDSSETQANIPDNPQDEMTKGQIITELMLRRNNLEKQIEEINSALNILHRVK